MDIQKKPPTFKIIGILIMLLLFIWWLLSGCEILKHRSSIATDSGTVSKAGSLLKDTSSGGRVSINTNTNKEAFDWFKTTLQYPRDTTANITNVYPSTIVYEGGKGTKEQTSITTDSTWFKNAIEQMQAKYDSGFAKMQASQMDSKSQTKGVGLMTVVLILLGYFVLTNGIKFISSKYSIVKK